MDGSTQARKVLLEGLFVAVIGAVVALAANRFSPRGLNLTRNYFPAGGVTATNASSPANLLAARLQERGIHLANSNQVSQFFTDPRYGQELIVFIDARDEQHYLDGHIPGACLFDYYHPEKYIATVLQLCQTAEQIVVYCNGGDCEDSVFAANMLRDAAIPGEKLFVYGGGIAEWTTNGHPVEVGPRHSGQFKGAPK